MASARLFRVILPVDSLDDAVRFYTALLDDAGLRISPGRHYFRCGEVTLAVYDPTADGDARTPRPNFDHVYFAVDDLEAVLRARSASVVCRERSVTAAFRWARSLAVRGANDPSTCRIRSAILCALLMREASSRASRRSTAGAFSSRAQGGGRRRTNSESAAGWSREVPRAGVTAACRTTVHLD